MVEVRPWSHGTTATLDAKEPRDRGTWSFLVSWVPVALGAQVLDAHGEPWKPRNPGSHGASVVKLPLVLRSQAIKALVQPWFLMDQRIKKIGFQCFKVSTGSSGLGSLSGCRIGSWKTGDEQPGLPVNGGQRGGFESERHCLAASTRKG